MSYINSSGEIVDLFRFVTKSSTKTPKSTVTVTSVILGNFTYEAPAGFQYDRFMMYNFPEYVIAITHPHNSWMAEVKDREANRVIETHIGLYEGHTVCDIRNEMARKVKIIIEKE